MINKVDTIDSTCSAYRTFNYEVLAGPDDMKVEMREEDCVFRFDYSKVYWNSRLNTEHKRLVDLFRPGELVADVMAGVGPFAVPAGKKGVFVWANDLNPDSYESLKDAIVRNKVYQYRTSREVEDFVTSYITKADPPRSEPSSALLTKTGINSSSSPRTLSFICILPEPT